MQLRLWLALTLGGLLASILLISGVTFVATSDLAKRIQTVDQAAAITWRLEAIEQSRRAYQVTSSVESLNRTRSLIDEIWSELATLSSMSSADDPGAPSIQDLHRSFERYRELLELYAQSEVLKATASEKMTIELDKMKSMASDLKDIKESDYHRAFAVSQSIGKAEEFLKTTLRLTALANEVLVIQMSIERSIALFLGAEQSPAADVHVGIGQIVEIADRIRWIERSAVAAANKGASLGLADKLAASSNQFLIDFDDFRLAKRNQLQRAEDMSKVAEEVTRLLQRINAFQTEAARQSSVWTTRLSMIVIATALVLGCLSFLAVHNKITAPLTNLTRTMNRMSTGNLANTVPGQDRRDELGAMARALEVFRANSLEARRLAEENILVERRLAEEKADAALLEQSLQHERDLNAQQRQFVSFVSHEFRTPLAIIDGKAQRLIRKGDEVSSEVRLDSLRTIREAVNRLIGLMERVLDSARLEAGAIEFKPTVLDLRTLVQDACKNQQEIAGKHEIKTDITALPQQFEGDSKLLHQVVVNLLSNAVKYSPDADLVEVIGASDDDGVEISVRDFGVGIPEDELPKLFQRFFRASTSAGIQGTGIGLNLVHALVEMHGGYISLSSVKGEGSTFNVRLPCERTMPDVAKVA